MSGFGGAVKLTGESEYRRALAQITQSLKTVASEMQVVSSSYNNNDKSLSTLKSKQEALNGVLEKQKNVLAQATSAYTSFKAKVDEQGRVHNDLVQKYENEKKKLEELEKTEGKASDAYKNQQKVVEDLAHDVAKSTDAYQANQNALGKLETQMNNAQVTVNKTSQELDNLGKEAEESGEDAVKGGEGFTVLKGVLANLATQGINLAIQGLKKLGGMFINIGKEAYSSYASYEQLVGGIETLFGARGAKSLEEYISIVGEAGMTVEEYASSVGKTVSEVTTEYNNLEKAQSLALENASNAYKTAGLSANEYMENVTSFSATLIQGLNGDTVKAVEYADMAMIDMADNANKMGTDMTSIQNAYQGFAKDNYTMLDNLKLGYGGTQGEMARLINDSGVLGDSIEITAETVKEVPFDKIIEAIHVTQEQIGITGTTTKEAMGTIEGSTRMAQASWQNLITGLADDTADFDKLVNNFLDSLLGSVDETGDRVGGVFSNMLPRVSSILEGMGTLVTSLVSDLLPEIVKIISDQTPQLVSSGQKLLDALFEGLTTSLPIVADLALNLIETLATGLLSNLPKLVSTATQIVSILLSSLSEIIPKILQAVIDIAPQIASTLSDAIPMLIQSAIDFLMAIVDAIPTICKSLLKAMPDVINSVITGLAKGVVTLLRGAKDLFMAIVEALPEVIDALTEALPEVIEAVFSALSDAYPELLEAWLELFTAVIEALPTLLEAVDNESISKIIEAICQGFIASTPLMLEAWKLMFKVILDEMPVIGEALLVLVEALLNQVIENIKIIFPQLKVLSTDLMKRTGKFFGQMIKMGVQKATAFVKDIMSKLKELPSIIWSVFLSAISKVVAWGADMRSKAITAGTDFVNSVMEKLNELPSKIYTKVQEAISKLSEWVANMKTKGLEGARGLVDSVVSGLSGVADRCYSIGRNIVQGIWNGMSGSYDWIKARIREWVGNVTDFLKKVFKIGSPSKLMADEVGVFLAQGIGVGFEDEMKDVANQMGDAIPKSYEVSSSVKGVSGARYGYTSTEMVNAFKQALSEMKIELDDQVAGRFVDKTVTRLIYS